jgi:hypothetical protein
VALLQFEGICHERFREYVQALEHNESESPPRVEYISCISAAASALGVDDNDVLNIRNFVPTGDYGNNGYDYVAFENALQTVVTLLQIKTTRDNKRLSIVIPAVDKQKLHHHVAALRVRIEESAFELGKKDTLNTRLDEFISALADNRFNLARCMVIVASRATTGPLWPRSSCRPLFLHCRFRATITAFTLRVVRAEFGVLRHDHISQVVIVFIYQKTTNCCNDRSTYGGSKYTCGQCRV